MLFTLFFDLGFFLLFAVVTRRTRRSAAALPHERRQGAGPFLESSFQGWDVPGNVQSLFISFQMHQSQQ